MTVFYIASTLKPLLSSLDKTEIWSFKWVEHRPLEITPAAIAAVVPGRCSGTPGPSHPRAHKAPVLLPPPVPARPGREGHQHHPTPGREGQNKGFRGEMVWDGPCQGLDRRTPGTRSPVVRRSVPGLSGGTAGGKRGKKQLFLVWVFPCVTGEAAVGETFKGKAPGT